MIKLLPRNIQDNLNIKTIFLNLIIILIYLGAGKLGLSLAFLHPSATAIWPPTGIALAAFIFFGHKITPAIFIGAFLTNYTNPGTLFTSLGIATGNTLEGLLGAYLINRFAGGRHTFDTTKNIFKFTVLAAFLSTLVSASIGVITLIAGNKAILSDVPLIWLTWYLGDMGGNLIVAPLLLVWGSHRRFNIHYRLIPNLLLSFAILGVVTEIVFTDLFAYAYLIIPIGVWIAFWFGRRGASAATLLVAIISIFFSLNGLGPFAHESSLNQSLILLQLFIGTFSLTSLVFATMVLTVKESEKALTANQMRFQALIENSFD
jgi:integral membrane sensor domain MASE1